MMRALPVAVMLVCSLTAISSFGEMPPSSPSCCACLPAERATTGDTEAAGRRTIQALLCAEIFSIDERSQFDDQCTNRGGNDIVCIAPLDMSAGAAAQDGDNLDCNALLLAENIACPGAAPAPLLDRRALGGLGVLLAGLGAWTVRRRRA